MTAEEHLRQDIGTILTQLLFQNAMLKADIDKAQEQLKNYQNVEMTNRG